VQGIENGDAGALASLVTFLTLVTGCTSLLVSSDDSGDFVERVTGKQALYENARNPNWQPPKKDSPYEPLPVAYITKLDSSTAVSDPPTFEQYQSELERALRAMTGEAPPAVAPVQQSPMAPVPQEQIVPVPPNPLLPRIFASAAAARAQQRNPIAPLPQNPVMSNAFASGAAAVPPEPASSAKAPPAFVPVAPVQQNPHW